MNEPSTRSPFAAMSSQEQQEQWLCWQTQRMAQQPAEPTDEGNRPESVVQARKPTVSRFAGGPGKSQYTAVVQRIRRAAGRAQAYTSCQPVETTVQPSSGS